MRFAYYIKKRSLSDDPRLSRMFSQLRDGGVELYEAAAPGSLEDGTDALLSIGGDGTFLSAACIAVPSDVPVLGVNFGRLGFLSTCNPEDLPSAVFERRFGVEERGLLEVSCDVPLAEDFWSFALNETAVSRIGASMLGIDVCVDGEQLPTWWADGLLVATSTGSTAYSLSAGGPICTPDAKVMVVTPVSPHNLNIRPIVLPLSSRIDISLRSRDDRVTFSVDNRTCTIPSGASVRVCAAPVKLRRLSLGQPDFFKALRTRLLWGEDVRNSNETL